MTVLCVNNGLTYADLVSADAAVGGTDFGTETVFEIDGSVGAALTLSNTDYPSSLIIRPKAGQETTGVISVGAQLVGSVTMLVVNGVVRDLRTNRINTNDTAGTLQDSLVTDGLGGDAFNTFDNGAINNCIAYNCDDGFISPVKRLASNVTNCTAIDCGRFGFANTRASDSVALITGNQAFFNEPTDSANLWEDDGTGTNTITEPVATDIFVDYANGDYRIKSDSSVGAAGAGAFLESGSEPGEIVTSSITADLDIRSSTLANTAADIDFRNAISSYTQLDVDIRAAISQSISATFDVRNGISASVLNDVDIRSSILNSVWSDVDLRNEILAAAGYVVSDLEIRNAISGAVISDIDLRNKILGSVSSDVDLRNNLLQSTARDIDVRTPILTSTYQNIDYRNQILGIACVDVDIRNGIDGIRASRHYSFLLTEQIYSFQEQEAFYSFTTQPNQYSF